MIRHQRHGCTDASSFMNITEQVIGAAIEVHRELAGPEGIRIWSVPLP